ncbi:hypothetical protein SGMN_39040 [Stenotrophomonas geniculata]
MDGNGEKHVPGCKPKLSQPQRISIRLSASGARAGFRHGVWRYTLNDDQLVKRDTRRAVFNERNDVRDRRPDYQVSQAPVI